MNKFKHLDVPRQWTETFTKYPHGLTIFEALVDWTSQVDKMVDNINDWNDYLDGFVDNFEFELRDEVQQTITKWQNEGFLEVIINAALNTRLDEVEDVVENVQTSLNTRLDEVEDVVENVQTSLNSRFIDVTNPGHPLEKAIGDGVTDNTTILQNIVDYCHDNNLNLYIPEGEYIIKDTLFIKENIKVVDMVGKIVYDGTHDRVAVQVGNENLRISGNKYSLKVRSKDKSNWENRNYVGIKLINFYEVFIETLETRGFTIGCQCYATNGNGFVYNEIHLTTLYNNLISLELVNETLSGMGWVNENLFIGGRFGILSSLDTQKPDERVGVLIHSKDETYKNNNNNVFLKPSFELRANALPIHIKNGSMNSFEKIRNEGNGSIVALIENNSSYNLIDVGYGRSLISETSPINRVNESVQSQFIGVKNKYLIYNSGFLPEKLEVVDEVVQLGELKRIDTDGNIVSTPSTATRHTMYDDYLYVSTQAPIGVYINTEKVKKFRVSKIVGETKGRVMVSCFNKEGERIGSSSNIVVYGAPHRTPFFHSSYGGVFRHGTDTSDDFYFQVDDEVKKIFVSLYGDLKSFSIFSCENDATCWY